MGKCIWKPIKVPESLKLSSNVLKDFVSSDGSVSIAVPCSSKKSKIGLPPNAASIANLSSYGITLSFMGLSTLSCINSYIKSFAGLEASS